VEEYEFLGRGEFFYQK